MFSWAWLINHCIRDYKVDPESYPEHYQVAIKLTVIWYGSRNKGCRGSFVVVISPFRRRHRTAEVACGKYEISNNEAYSGLCSLGSRSQIKCLTLHVGFQLGFHLYDPTRPSQIVDHVRLRVSKSRMAEYVLIRRPINPGYSRGGARVQFLKTFIPLATPCTSLSCPEITFPYIRLSSH